MDNVCHSLLGAALGTAGLARRTRFGMATLVIASNLPDLDVAVFATSTLAMSFRRGWTHGVLAQAALPVLLAAAMHAWARRRPAPDQPPARFGWLLVLGYIGVLTHVLLDFLNSYGVRLLKPFSDRWFYGDALYIVDPWLYLVLGIGVWLSMVRERRGRPHPTRPARLGLVVAGLYMATMLGSNVVARAAVQQALTRAGRPDARFMVTPLFANVLRREVLVDLGDRYEKGVLWFEPRPHFRPAGFGVDKGFATPMGQAAMATPRGRAYLAWSRFPFVWVDRTVAPPRLLLNDYRYTVTGEGGWAGMVVEPPPR